MKVLICKAGFFLFTLVCGIAMAATCGAQVWDLWDDVAGSANAAAMGDNPNGAWSWLYSAENDIAEANFSLYSDYNDDCGQTERDCWTFGGWDPSLSISKVDTDYPAGWDPSVTIPGGSVFFHPSDDRYSVIRWTSPVNGVVDISYRFKDIDDNCGEGVDWWMLKGNSNLADGTLGNGGDTNMRTLDDVAVTSGDHINFVLGPKDNHACDSTILEATITDVTPQAQVDLNAASYSAGDTFTADFKLNSSIIRPLTVFAVMVLPGGAMRNLMTLDTPVTPVASNVPKLDAPYTKQLLSTVIPAGAPLGSYEAVIVFFDPTKPITGRGDAFLDVNKTFNVK